MRLLVSSLFAAGLLASQSASAGQCASPQEKLAFDVVGLKSQLMVTALTCDARNQYNTFVTRFRRSLLSGEHALNVYFGRHGGTRAHDDYITLLANVQSEAGLHLGTTYCANKAAMFDEVLALQSPKALPAFAAVQDVAQPMMVPVCAVAERRVVRHHFR